MHIVFDCVEQNKKKKIINNIIIIQNENWIAETQNNKKSTVFSKNIKTLVSFTSIHNLILKFWFIVFQFFGAFWYSESMFGDQYGKILKIGMILKIGGFF